MPDVERAIVGSARRRKERRLRSWWRHERMSIAAALVEATHHSAPRSGWPGSHDAPRGQETTSVREDPELFTLFEEELGGCRPDKLAAVSEPQGSLPRGARILSAPLLCVPRLNNGSVAVVDCSVLDFLERRGGGEEDGSARRLDPHRYPRQCRGPGGMASMGGQPSFVERWKEEKEEEEEEEAAEDFLRPFFHSHGSPAQFLVVDVPVLMQRRPWWSLRRFAWLDSGYMYCDSLGSLLDVFHSFSTCWWRLGSWSPLSSCSSWFLSCNTWFDSGY